VGRESLDFVFIDSSHDYDSVLKDLIAWYIKVRVGGLFCGHDLNLTGVRDALNDFGIEYKESGVDNVWYIEK
jgi:predicted O-methyltransferase YrrM